jgi:manganese/iron transport system permease protein
MADPFLPFAFPFMRQALLIAGLVALPMALLSCFLILRGWSLMGDAISHAVLPGVVLAHAAGLPIALGAFAAGLLCATATGWLRDSSRIKEDTAMGVVFAGLFGLGLVLYAALPGELHLSHLLFGDMLGIGWDDIRQAALIAAAVSLAVVLKRADLAAATFDPLHARAIGLPVRLMHYGLLALIALSVVGALTAVGIILAIALLITPGATAALWARRIGSMLLVAAVFGVVTAQAGVYAAFWLDAAPAPTIVLVQTLGFVLSLAVARRSASAGVAAR